MCRLGIGFVVIFLQRKVYSIAHIYMYIRWLIFFAVFFSGAPGGMAEGCTHGSK